MTEKSTSKGEIPKDYGFVIDIDEVTALAGGFGLRIARDEEIEAAIDLAVDLTGQELASPDVVRRVQATTQLTAWVAGDPVEGTFLFVPLSKAGEAAVRAGDFAPGGPDRAHLCAPGEHCHAIYVGVYAGRTREARRSIMYSSAAFSVGYFASLPCFARAATEDGARSMASLGFAPLEGSLPDLWVLEGRGHAESAAA